MKVQDNAQERKREGSCEVFEVGVWGCVRWGIKRNSVRDKEDSDRLMQKCKTYTASWKVFMMRIFKTWIYNIQF